MTQRIKGVLVTFDDDIREDDVEPLLAAMRLLRRVISVEPVPADISGHIARERARHDLAKQLWEVLYPERKVAGGG
jgi:hypothetical protein